MKHSRLCPPSWANGSAPPPWANSSAPPRWMVWGAGEGLGPALGFVAWLLPGRRSWISSNSTPGWNLNLQSRPGWLTHTLQSVSVYRCTLHLDHSYIPAKSSTRWEGDLHSANIIDHHEMEDGVCKQEVSKCPFRWYKHKVSLILWIDLDAQAYYKEEEYEV